MSSASARSWMRRIFSTVFGPHEPALTVGSFAISATARQSIVPIPVTTPSAPSPSSCQLASSPSSAKEPSSRSSAMRSRTGSLPCSRAFSRWRSGPPASARDRLAERAHQSGRPSRQLRRLERRASWRSRRARRPQARFERLLVGAGRTGASRPADGQQHREITQIGQKLPLAPSRRPDRDAISDAPTAPPASCTSARGAGAAGAWPAERSTAAGLSGRSRLTASSSPRVVAA